MGKRRKIKQIWQIFLPQISTWIKKGFQGPGGGEAASFFIQEGFSYRSKFLVLFIAIPKIIPMLSMISSWGEFIAFLLINQFCSRIFLILNFWKYKQVHRI